GKISVKVNTTGYGGRILKKTIKVYTNDKKTPVSDLIVKGDVKKFATISPNRASLNGEVGKDIRISVKIAPATRDLFDLIEAKADSGENIRIALTASGEGDRKTYILTVENTRTTPGRYQDTIRLITTNSVRKELTIPVYGNIKAPQIVAITPSANVRLRGYAGEPLKASVRITPNDNSHFSILEVKPRDGKNIKCDLQEVRESGKKVYVLTVENLKREKGRYYDTINLKTDSKQMPEIRIGVSGRISDKPNQ
ncbi:MAG: hypothetical protein ISS68_05555, partial [Desulfobacteraceae bacterium]|nr:hypothetical protein [Desulfobacteraceae bacterium]